MKYKNYLDEILGRKSKVKVLRYLVKFNQGASVRELSRRIGATEPNLSVILKELEKNGILVSQKYGTALVFKLNDGHYLVEKVVIPLFVQEQSAIDDLGHFIAKRLKTVFISMIIFGSVARRDEHPKSDLDIAFVVKDRSTSEKIEQELLDLSPAIIKKFGNQISPYIIEKNDFIKKLKANDPLIRSIFKEGRVLAGSLVTEIL